jgi:hypothetical protein
MMWAKAPTTRVEAVGRVGGPDRGEGAREEGLLGPASALDQRGRGRRVVDAGPRAPPAVEVLADRGPQLGVVLHEGRAHQRGVHLRGQRGVGFVVDGDVVGPPPEARRARVCEHEARKQPQRRAPRPQRAQGGARPVGVAEEAHMVRLGQRGGPVERALGRRRRGRWGGERRHARVVGAFAVVVGGRGGHVLHSRHGASAAATWWVEGRQAAHLALQVGLARAMAAPGRAITAGRSTGTGFDRRRPRSARLSSPECARASRSERHTAAVTHSASLCTAVIAAWGLAAVLAMYRMLQTCPMRPTSAKHPRADPWFGAVEIRDPCHYNAVRFNRRKVARLLIPQPITSDGTASIPSLHHIDAIDWPTSKRWMHPLKAIEAIQHSTCMDTHSRLRSNDIKP